MAGELAPNPMFPERVGSNYEVKTAPNTPGGRGPLRFEEGIATDTDVPNEFVKGVMQGYVTAPGRPNHNANVYEKYPEETMAQRAHMGSASWTESPTYLGEFAHGSFADNTKPHYEQVNRSGGHYRRLNPAEVND